MLVITDNSSIRSEAWAAGRPHWRFMALAFLFIGAVGQFNQVFGTSNMYDSSALTVLGNMLASVCWYFATAAWLSKGYARVMLNIVNGKTPALNDLFIGSKDFTRSLYAVIGVFIKTLLWCLLFLVPGIIAWFKYSLTYFVLNNRPDLSGWQCVSESARLMRGNKMKLFRLLFWYYMLFAAVALVLYLPLFTLLDKRLLLGGNNANFIASTIAFMIASVIYNICSFPALAKFYTLVTADE